MRYKEIQPTERYQALTWDQPFQSLGITINTYGWLCVKVSYAGPLNPHALAARHTMILSLFAIYF